MKSAAFNSTTLQSSIPTPYSIFFCVMVLFALKRPRECETWLLAAQKLRQTNEAFLSQKVFPKNVPPLKKDLIRQPWWWQGLHTFGAKRQKESCCQARLVVALCAEMSFSWTFLGKRNCAVEVNFPVFFPPFWCFWNTPANTMPISLSQRFLLM